MKLSEYSYFTNTQKFYLGPLIPSTNFVLQRKMTKCAKFNNSSECKARLVERRVTVASYSNESLNALFGLEDGGPEIKVSLANKCQC